MKKLVIIFTIAMFMQSCNLADSIDQNPPNNLVPENVVNNEDDARAVLNGVYSQIISYTSPYYYMYSETIPSALIGTMSQAGSSDDNAEFFDNNIQSENSTVKSYWLIMYKVIDGANTTIYETSQLANDQITPQAKKEIIGEARFLRAMATFDALRYFGQFYDANSPLGIIVRTEPVNFTTRSKKRSTVQQTYTQILEDLDFAIENAPSFTVSYKGSKLAALALKARVLLYKGDYEGAARLANQVITSGNRSLEPTFADVFDTGIFSSEPIFMTYRDAESDTEENNRKRFYSGRVGEGWFTQLMENDPRQTATYNEEDVLKTNNEASFRPTFFMRLAEMYLIKAEATLRNTNSVEQAKPALNVVYERVGLPPSTATTIAQLENELFEAYITELAFENGSDWFAGIRFNRAMELKENIISENQYILPLPKTEIEGNEALTLADQNPGYE
tara:strand:+ start:151943 stop:153286 length:1344 start_codon:yes stop_codon:yes gene_type:complete